MGVWDRTRRNILSVRLRIWSALASSRLTVVGSVLLRRWPILVEMEVNKDHGFCHLISAGPVLLMWMLARAIGHYNYYVPAHNHCFLLRRVGKTRLRKKLERKNA